MIRNLKPFQSLTLPWRCDSGQSGTRPLDFCLILCYGVTMMNNKSNNPYAQQILAKGRDLPKATVSDRKVPARFADRFATYEEYAEAMADFLNGM